MDGLMGSLVGNLAEKVTKLAESLCIRRISLRLMPRLAEPHGQHERIRSIQLRKTVVESCCRD